MNQRQYKKCTSLVRAAAVTLTQSKNSGEPANVNKTFRLVLPNIQGLRGVNAALDNSDIGRNVGRLYAI